MYRLLPITRSEFGQVFGNEVTHETIGHLRGLGSIAAGPRSPQLGSLEDAGLLSKDRLLAGDFAISLHDEAKPGASKR